MKTFKEVGASDARKNPGKLLSQVFECGEQVIITRSGKPVAALVPVDWLERRLPLCPSSMSCPLVFSAASEGTRRAPAGSTWDEPEWNAA